MHLEVAEASGMETVTIGDGHYKRVVIRRASADTASRALGEAPGSGGTPVPA